MGSYARISLLKSDIFEETIKEFIRNIGIYEWTPSPYLPTGYDYTVRVEDAMNSKVIDDSIPFTIDNSNNFFDKSNIAKISSQQQKLSKKSRYHSCDIGIYLARLSFCHTPEHITTP